MSEEQTTETATETVVETTEPTHEHAESADETTFSRSYVEKLRDENAKLRVRAQDSDELRHRLHSALVEQDGRLADPGDLDYSDEHLDPEALTAAIDALLEAKPHLRSRRIPPNTDVGQGKRGPADHPASLLGLIRQLS